MWRRLSATTSLNEVPPLRRYRSTTEDCMITSNPSCFWSWSHFYSSLTKKRDDGKCPSCVSVEKVYINACLLYVFKLNKNVLQAPLDKDLWPNGPPPYGPARNNTLTALLHPASYHSHAKSRQPANAHICLPFHYLLSASSTRPSLSWSRSFGHLRGPWRFLQDPLKWADNKNAE